MEHRWLNKSVETAQRRVEQQNYAIRKRTLEYDDVMNKQRAIVYELRGTVLRGSQEDVHATILDVMNDLVLTQCERYLSDEKNANVADFENWLGVTFPVSVSEDELKPLLGKPDEIGALVMGRVKDAYESKCAVEDQAVLPFMERGVFLNAIDRQWQDYLRAMDDLRHGVNLRAYGQRDPLIEYKREAFDMFERLMTQIKTEVVNMEFRATTAANLRRMMAAAEANAKMRQQTNQGEEVATAGEIAAARKQTASTEPKPMQNKPAETPKTVSDVFASMINEVGGRRRPPMMPGRAPSPAAAQPHVGRNDPCPCGSGKKFKKCCGANLF